MTVKKLKMKNKWVLFLLRLMLLPEASISKMFNGLFNTIFRARLKNMLTELEEQLVLLPQGLL